MIIPSNVGGPTGFSAFSSYTGFSGNVNGAAYYPPTKKLFVSSSSTADGGFSVIDTTTNTKTKTINSGYQYSYQTFAMAYNPVDGFIYSTANRWDGTSGGKLIRIDPVSESVVDAWDVGNSPYSIAVSPSGIVAVGESTDNKISYWYYYYGSPPSYFSNYQNYYISAPEARPWTIAFGDNNRFYAGNMWDNSLSSFTTGGTPSYSNPTMTASTRFSSSGGRALLGYNGKMYSYTREGPARLVVINTATNTVSSTLTIGTSYSNWPSMTIWEGKLYVSYNYAIAVIDTATDSLVKTIDMSDGATNYGYGGWLLAANGNLYYQASNGIGVIK